MSRLRLAGCAGLFFVIAATTVSANPIVVRSGDHNGFTRLVMQLPDSVQWQVTETRGLKTITVSGHDAGFDISRVFDVIPRDQLTNVRNFPSSLELELSCDCDLNTFIEQSEFLVVDIIDGPALPPLEPLQPSQFIPAQPESRFNFGDLLWSEFTAPEVNLAPSDQELTIPALDEGNSAREIARSAETALVEDTRGRLLFGIGSATSRGILEPAAPDLQVLKKEEPVPQSQGIFDSSEQSVTFITPGNGNIRITNSRDTPVSGSVQNLMISGAICAEPDGVLVSEWGNDQPFSVQVSKLRDALYTEVDRLDPGKAKQLARLYIYFGFGAEAKQVLRLSDDLVTTNPELMDLADIMEYGFARNPRLVHRFSDCDSDLALWSIMAAIRVPTDQIVNESAVLRALAKLPMHLKQFIAPMVSKKFTERGNLEAASIALRNVELASDTLTPISELAKAKIEQKSGNAAIAEDLLSDVIQENTAETPEALIAFVDNRLAEGKLVPADVALLIETYAFERRRGPIARDLLRAHVIASSYSGQFSKAFKAMENETITKDNELTTELESHIFSALASNATDMTFLEAFYMHFPSSAENMPTKAASETAARLLELGFPADADGLLSSISPKNRDSRSKLIHAEALLQLAMPEDALLILDDLDGKNADYLRAQILLALDQNKSAFDLFQATNTPDEAVRSAWLADEWVDIVPPETPVLGEIRSLAQQPVSEIAPEDGMLATTNTALERSANARGVLEELLQGFIVSP